MTRLSVYCTSGVDIWMTISLLICFHIVEWHKPDKGMRHFGMLHEISECCDTEATLHQYNLRG